MQIELTEQQARSLARAARLGLDLVRRLKDGNTVTITGKSDVNPGDEAAAYKAADKLERAVKESVGG